MTKKTGFSLIEYLLIVTLLTVASLVVALNFRAAREKTQVTAAAIETVTLLEKARNLAVRGVNQNYYRAVFSPSANSTRLTVKCGDDQPPVATCAASEDIEFSYPLPSGLIFSNRPQGNRLYFQTITGRTAGPSRSQLKASQETVTISSAKWAIDIIIPPTGTIYQKTIRKL